MFEKIRQFSLGIGIICSMVILLISGFALADEDSSPPVIKSLELSKVVYSSGEDLVIYFEASDDSSGINIGCCSGVALIPEGNVFRHSDRVNGRVSLVEDDRYQVRNLPINEYVDTKIAGKYKITSFDVSDIAGNRAELFLKNVDDEYYTDQNGIETEIQVLIFKISHNEQGDSSAPTISSLRLSRLNYRAAEELAIEFDGSDDVSGIAEGCCVSVYILPSENVFRHSDAVNGRVKSEGDGHYSVTNLPINPNVKGNSLHTITHFSISDIAGNDATLRVGDSDPRFYTDQSGNLTDIEVLIFRIIANKNADNIPPIITKLELIKKVYKPGEDLVIIFEGSDDVSGIGLGCCSAVRVNPPGNVFKNSDSVNGRVSQVEDDLYQVRNLPINEHVDTSITDEFTITSFDVSDIAGNRAELYLRDEQDEFYTDQGGNLTTLEVLKFKIQTQSADISANEIACHARIDTFATDDFKSDILDSKIFKIQDEDGDKFRLIITRGDILLEDMLIDYDFELASKSIDSKLICKAHIEDYLEKQK